MDRIRHLRHLKVGEHVVFGGRVEPLTVRDLEEIEETDDGIEFTHQAVLSGPRMGTVVMKQTSSGRILAYLQGTPPPNVVQNLQRHR